MSVGVTLEDADNFFAKQDSIKAAQQTSPTPADPNGGGMAAFQNAASQMMGGETPAQQGPEHITLGESMVSAFGEGAANSLTLGLSGKLTKHDLISAEGIAQLAGQITGEIPYWFVGGKLTSMALRRGMKGLQAVEATGGAFGKVAKLTRVHGVNISEAATAVGVDTGRAVLGEDEYDELTLGKIAIDVSVPFAKSVFKVSKERGALRRQRAERAIINEEIAEEAAAERLAQRSANDNALMKQLDDDYLSDRQRVSSGLHAPVITEPASEAAHRVRQAELNKAFKALTEEEQNILHAYDNAYATIGGGPAHIESLMDLVRMGAPIDEVAILNGVDDIADYLRHHQKYPLNNPGIANNKEWAERARNRVNKDLSPIKEMFTIRHRDYGPGTRTTPGLQELGTLADESEDILLANSNRNRRPDSNAKLKDKQGRFTSVRKMAQNRGTELGDATETGLIEQHMLHPIHGGSEAGFDDYFDKFHDITQINMPRGKIDDTARMLMDGLAGLPVINDAVISATRVVESMGNSGRQMGVLLRKARMWNAMRTGQAQSDMLNAFKDLKTPEQYAQMVSHLSRGTAVDDEAVKTAVTVFRSHHKYVENMMVKQEVKILMADGKTKALLGDMIEENFFPQIHNWDRVLKEDDSLMKLGQNLKKKFGQAFGAMSDKEVGTMYINNARNAKSTRFSSLYERTVDLPGWMGDPSTLAARGNKGYIADVQESILNFFEDSYSLAGTNRVFGNPTGYKMFDESNLMTDLAPIHNYIKGIIDVADDTLRRTISAGKPLPVVDKTISAFGTPRKVEAAANRGDEIAKRLLHQAQTHFTADAKFKQLPWKMQNLLVSMREEGHNVQVAQDLLESVMGTRSFRPDHVKASEFARNTQIVTKLGTLVVENIGQIGFTITKTGLKNSVKALGALVQDWHGSEEFARISGVLGENAIRGLEAEAGRSFAGKFLKSSGFQFSENLLRTHAAMSGRMMVEDLFRQVGKNGANKAGTTAQRQLRKLGFNVSMFVDDAGQMTDYGTKALNALDGNGEKGIADMIHRMAGFETSRQTQFLVDAMDSPIFQSTPAGKVLLQYKSFLSNTTKFVVREVFDEARHGNYKPLVRMVMTGVTLGEVTQNARQLTTGEDPASRGQQGWIRDLLAGAPDNDEAAMEYLGKKFSTSDVAARLVENMVGVGYGGMFVAMLQSATVGGKLRMMEFLGGPTVGTAIDTGAAVAKAFGGDPSQLGRRALRELPGIAGAATGVPGAAFAAAALGKSAAIATLPTEFQQERSLYTTPEEQAVIAKRQVVRRYNDVRSSAQQAVLKGDRGAATKMINQWNNNIGSDLSRLMSAGALNSGMIQRLVFDGDEIGKILAGQAPEQGAFALSADRLQAGANRVGEIF